MRCAISLLMLLTPVMVHPQNTVDGSQHDLSVNGPGPLKAISEPQVCLFCHASHILNPNSPKPLWNQQLSITTAYAPYASSTYNQTNNPPSARSKLCLSCHDGTVAVGQTIAKGPIATQGTLPASTNLGTDLSSDHPFGFTMPANDDGEIKLSLTTSPPATSDPAVKLFDNKIECITCHNPHTPNLDISVQFMVRSNENSALCTACHDTSRSGLANWSAGKHATSVNVVNAGAQLPYPTVAANACLSCHRGHNTPGAGTRLLRGGEKTACGTCHGASPALNPALRDIVSGLNSTYAHPVGASISPPHDLAEPLPVNSSRHAECSDCHNPHAAQATGTASAPGAQQSLTGVSGISSSGTIVRPASNQYEICFKCHADSTNKPQSSSYNVYGREPVRATWSLDPYNVRLDLNSAVARHNVTQASRGWPGISPSQRATMLDVNGAAVGPSLVTTAYLYCTDCHNSDGARASGGSAPNGPHGSTWTHVLERQYQGNTLPALGPGAALTPIAYASGVGGPYALCDKCHDLDNKLNLGAGGTGTDAVFGEHRRHVVSQGASCSVCHAAHGVQGGAVLNNQHLVNFDTQIVAPVGANPQPYVDTTQRKCFLTCHNQAHNGTSY